MLDLTDAQLAGLESGELSVDAVVSIWRPPQTIATGLIRWTDAPRDVVRMEEQDDGTMVSVTYSSIESNLAGVQPPGVESDGGRDLFGLQFIDQDGAYHRDLDRNGHVGLQILVGAQVNMARGAAAIPDLVFYRGGSVAAAWQFIDAMGNVLNVSFGGLLDKFDSDFGMTTSEDDQHARDPDDDSMAHAHEAQDFEWGQPTGGF